MLSRCESETYALIGLRFPKTSPGLRSANGVMPIVKVLSGLLLCS